jgi:large conductance mechanosensitive channel protein
MAKTTEEKQQKRAERREKARNASLAARRKARGGLSGFVDFIRKQGVVGLAVGLAIGLQATEFTRAIVNSLITPIVDLIAGPEGLTGLQWTLNIGDRSGTFDIGILIDAMLKFLAVAFVIYFVVKGLRLDRLDKPKEAK